MTHGIVLARPSGMKARILPILTVLTLCAPLTGCGPDAPESAEKTAGWPAGMIEGLSRGADTILEGEVRGRRFVFDAAAQDVYTEITFAVVDTYKGRDAAVRTLRVPGGVHGDDVVFSPHIPQLDVGERYVVFLREDPRAETPFVGPRAAQRVRLDATGVERVEDAPTVPLELRESAQAEDDRVQARARPGAKILDGDTIPTARSGATKPTRQSLIQAIRRAVRS